MTGMRSVGRSEQGREKVMSILYTAVAKATGGRSGRATTPDGALDLALVRPKELGGTGQGGTNPEQLFACGYAACFGATLDALARQRKLSLTRNDVAAHIGLAKREAGGFILTARLEVTLEGVDRDTAEELAATAHEVCPYSNSIKASVPVEVVVVDAGPGTT